ncbi:MAG TPA: FAD-dependent oxidoreductase [Acidiferrobacterales bacterium]
MSAATGDLAPAAATAAGPARCYPVIPIVHAPRASAGGVQDLLPHRYGLAVRLFALAAFTLAFVGWLNETWLFLFDNPVWLNRYTEYAVILAFGLWRIYAERNRYTRLRLIVLVAAVTLFWWLIPWLKPFYEPYVGYLWGQPLFPSLHVPGTVTFFLVLGAVFLFGRRVICGWNCPCVGIRETVGFAFRDRTVRGKWAWRLRHTKWFFFVFYVGVMVVTQYPPNSWTVSFVGLFYVVVALTYFGTFFIAPLTGNRFYCRYLCPYGATFGLLNHAGFYGIRLDKDKCNDCRRCEQVCDMGIPVWEQGKRFGRITGIEDCMGCGRCVVSCPTDALEIRDVRNLFRPGLVQNGSHLMKKVPPTPVPRAEGVARPPAERVRDTREIYLPVAAADIRQQAARCLDCGVPGCRSACPLGNRIPDWLQAAARGEFAEAATIAHATSPMPEVCGRLCPQHRLCEGACTRARDGGAVTIGAIEQAVTEIALDGGWTPPAPGPRNGRRVAVIGAGPAGLACADFLNRAGCAVTVFDRADEIGGLLAHGVPPFKLDPAVLARRRALWEAAGIGFRMNREVDGTMLGRLVDEHDAVFIALGAPAPRKVTLPGRGLTGVHGALDMLNSPNPFGGRRVLVLGGGDTAMDCARRARRAGAEVAVCVRAGEEGLRASPREVKAAREEGVAFHFRHQPLDIAGRAAVEAVRFRTPAGERRLACDAVILAFGFVARTPKWLAAFGVEADAGGHIRVHADGRTSHAKIYAGGDATTGPDLVVTALAAGRRAAESMMADWSITRRARHGLTAALGGAGEARRAPASAAART